MKEQKTDPVKRANSDLQDCVNALLLLDASKSYRELPEVLVTTLHQIMEAQGQRSASEFFKAVVLALMETVEERSAKLPRSVRVILARELIRIRGEIDSSELSLDWEHDIWIKDLQTLTLRLVPCGAQLVDLYGGCIPRSTAFGAGFGQFIRLARTVRSCGGFSGFVEFHTHTPTLAEFNETGWDECYQRVAEILVADPSLRGMVGSSWFYDPVVKEISPRLAYLQERPLSNGAELFKVGTSPATVANATSTSVTRRDLYDSGDYLPTEFLLVWPRQAMIQWAQKC